MKKIILSVSLVLVIAYLVISFWPAPKIEWHDAENVRWAKLHVPGWLAKTGFEMLSGSETGVVFENHLAADQIKKNRVLLNGSGVAVGDVDGDDLTDLYFCALDSSNVLYKNLGDWNFEDITENAGVACPDQFSSGATFADIDGDQDLDLLVTSIGGRTRCFINDGTGKFSDATEPAGLVSGTGATTMALADIEGDGDLDLYITNYKQIRTKDLFIPFELGFSNIVRKVNDHFEIAPKFKDHYRLETFGTQLLWFETAEVDRLYLNDGTGQFQEASFTSGRFLDEGGKPVDTLDLKDWGLMARFQDIDDDGDPDMYVCNDFDSPDRIWINDGTGHFHAIPRLAIRSTSNSSMAVDFSDIDRDGDYDFFVADMLSREHQLRKTQMGTLRPSIDIIGAIENRPQHMRNTLFLNRGDNTYAEIAQFSGVHASEWSWSVVFTDVDLDGFEDILITTGNHHDAQDLDTEQLIRQRASLGFIDQKEFIFMYPRLELQNIAFRNRGDLTFEDASDAWGFNSVDVSHGIALGDLDNDGDLDVVINRLNKPAIVYRNEATASRVAVRLKGLPPNTQGIGAKIRLLAGKVLQSKEVIAGGYYLSSSEPLCVFAVDENSTDLTLEVIWRSGKKSVVKGLKPNHIYEIDELGAETASQSSLVSDSVSPIFQDVSHLISHIHLEEPFNDFKRQPLLPNRLSQLGPGVAWHDLDGDHDDDLIITTGKGGQLACYRNDGQQGFHRLRDSNLDQVSTQEQSAVVGYTSGEGAFRLLVGVSNFEDSQPDTSHLNLYDFHQDGSLSTEQVSLDRSSIGPLALADYDSDGDLDLFAGGRTIPMRYPEPASSLLFQNEAGTFKLDEKNTPLLAQVGLVTSAVFSDVEGDGDPDLILAAEWGPIKVFRNISGAFADATEELGLSEYTGWWNGVTTGDLNEDGQLDIIASNWGLNNQYQFEVDQPLRLYYQDFNNDGKLDLIEAYYDPKMDAIVPERGLNALSGSLPFLRIRNPTHKVFASRSLDQLFGPKLRQAQVRQANTLAHTIFFNRGNRFEPVALPDEAQFAPAFYVGVADFDGDGHEDIFLSQNFFATRNGASRYDAGRGLWLKGNGSGQLQPLSGQKSGVKVYGEQRGAALGDYDRDGRVDFVVTQNGNRTKLFQNVGAKPGLRVRLLGSKANPSGVGSTIRLEYENGYGPAREIHAGSGYWSQDSAVQVMGMKTSPKSAWVRWPGGKVFTYKIPQGTTEVVLNNDGTVTAVQ